MHTPPVRISEMPGTPATLRTATRARYVRKRNELRPSNSTTSNRSSSSFLFNGSAEFMGWEIGNFGFEMILSQELPKIILEQAMPRLKLILQRFGINKEEIKYWALHPGGRAILDSMQKGLELSAESMIPSRIVLKNYGNMSSVSILFVLKEIISTYIITKGEYCCAVAFGPGLTMEVALDRKSVV